MRKDCGKTTGTVGELSLKVVTLWRCCGNGAERQRKHCRHDPEHGQSRCLCYVGVHSWAAIGIGSLPDYFSARRKVPGHETTYEIASITSSERRGWDSVNFRACPRAIKSCLPRVYPRRHAHDKCTRLSPRGGRTSDLGAGLLVVLL